ncbi:adenylate/guanylate cyclase domain-containing protein [Mycolicibacterium sp. ND9-15]|uniref:ATP-binding protein n=1 Tax=Mycolicibacterium sp. ND9-15 TaxID=3042320 RepID=UPI002DDA46D1|nr:adenylate/guanylate cyclase domain-containing protein [Mycolicibacterium sp. ND9-15]WSE58227.1 adenylate/guanylate cyclase domain-containing protein [Mycolicibacterium sp. ND9-15]
MNGGQKAVPTGVVTFLFTDIEGSTRRWEADAGEMRRALAAHDDTLRRTVESYGGWLFKHTGDGVCAAFASPGAAVDAAIAAQRSLELPVRMGIATGEAECGEGDYLGAVLNRTARLMAAGHGGQVLLDGTTAGLVRGIDLIGLGIRRLRDIAQPVEVLQVSAPGLRAQFPSLRNLEETPGNLRAPATNLIGREAQLAELETTLKSHRLLTLTGVGGVGKTRLAVELAAISAESFPDGAWLIDLAAVGDPTAVPDAVAAALGIVQQPGLTVTDSVAFALESRSRLLLFDNCEHVLDAAADIIEGILAASTAVKVIATSREGLGLAGEQLWPVPPLDIQSSAATLFAERALAVAPGVALDDDDDVITEICGRLDGIPLAIELAASRMQSMTVDEIRDRLDDRFRLLVGSRRGLDRHQTLRQAVQWSYDLLGANEKSLLNRCSVFAAGFELAGACAVSGSDDDMATLDLLHALVRKSLLGAHRSAGRTRFSMLETIRRFAEAQLVADGAADAARDAHARYFAAQESNVLALWDGPRQREAYAWLDTELANLRTAFRWAVDAHDLDTAAAIVVPSASIGLIAEIHEPFSWSEALLPAAEEADHPRLAQLYVFATWCYTTGRFDDATVYARAALSALDSGRYEPVPFDFECTMGGFYAALGDPEVWSEICRKVIARDNGTHVYARSALVASLAISDHLDEAIEESEDLPAVAEAEGNPQRTSFALFAYGVARRYSDPAAAYAAQSRALKIAQDSGSKQNVSFTSLALAMLAVRQARPLDALDNLALATQIRYDAGSFSLIDSPLAVLTVLFDQLQLYEPAARLAGRAATPMSEHAYPELAAAVEHLRSVLGDSTFEELARDGAAMGNAATVQFALEQIALARAKLASSSNG